MDFYEVLARTKAGGVIEVYPSFRVRRSKDLLVKGKSFYAIWDDAKGLWSTDIYDVQQLVDKDVFAMQKEIKRESPVVALTLGDFSSKKWIEFEQYVKSQPDSKHTLDNKIVFSNTPVKKEDYISHTLPYPMSQGPIDSYEELVSTLYSPEERAKFEWAIGAIIAGDAKDIQKFIVFYGDAGTGKSTILNIIQMLFEGYYVAFDAKALASTSNQFATEVFKSNPLIAIQHDGDLSRIEDNTKLNSIVSHEEMLVNEKYKSGYTTRINAFLFMGTNKPVKITDAKSGIIRRLIDVHPTGNKVPSAKYYKLMSQIPFELGAIAAHCLDVYQQMGKNYYNSYRPLNMIFQTDVFFNFVEYNMDIFAAQDHISLRQAYDMYKQYCDDSLVEFKLPRYKFREELKNYFKSFHEVYRNADGSQTRSVYEGFLIDKFVSTYEKKEETVELLELNCTESLFDKEYADAPAQYANENGTPTTSWAKNTTKLSELCTSRTHYVQLPDNHIVIDFDIKDESGEKSLERNLAEASKWPKTYAELSKSGSGIHLHYIYEGDTSLLSALYSANVEVKVFTGNASLRRRLTKCNDLPIATISGGLPMKEQKKMINSDIVLNEKGLRTVIEKNLKKEYHPGTKPSIDFIYKALEDAYNAGIQYDVRDLRQKVLTFAAKSTNHAQYCISVVSKMHFSSDNITEFEPGKDVDEQDKDIAFYDVEVFPNLFIVCWKYKGSENVIRMINPTPSDIDTLFNLKLVGFNNRRYDNHILYARHLGYTNEELFHLSSKLVTDKNFGDPNNGFFANAYGISYTDIYDFCSKKQSLKKWEIELGIHHQECPYRWDQPVPEDKWHEVAEYCENDVRATEATFNANIADFRAREILADLSGLTVNDTTNSHTKRIVFGQNRKPQSSFHYTHFEEPITKIEPEMAKFLKENTPLLQTDEWFEPNVSILPYFKGYKYENGHSFYRGEDPGRGGYVYAEPGMYWDVALLDVASMHPSSAEDLWAFGPYTIAFSQIKQARILIKHHNMDALAKMFDGKLIPYLKDELLDDLSYALKIAINSVYGLTSASFENEFRDPRNVNNIVALRGALFMIDLKYAVQERGFKVVHIKTDSIKIANATQEIIDFVMGFGLKYGYVFEHEATYDRMCLINDAVYIAKYDSHGIRTKGGKHANEWTATGARFAVPFVFKSIFSKEPIEFADMCETKSVSDAAMYLNMNEGTGIDNLVFVGRTGLFCPIKEGNGAGQLVRVKDNNFNKLDAVTGTKGYRWLEAEQVKALGLEANIDIGYYRDMVDEALESIRKFGDPEVFIGVENLPPWWQCHGECDNCMYQHNICGGLPF